MIARLSLLAPVLIGLCGTAASQDISVTKAEGQSRFLIQSAAVTDLSGVVWAGGDAFYAVADHPPLLVPLTLQIDRATGGIVRGEIGTPLPVTAPVSDLEGIAYVAATKTYYLSAETGSAVVRFRPGAVAEVLPVPRIFSQARKNLGLESVTWNDTAGHFWIANEEALLPDGPVSEAAGTLVRLQQFDAKFRPVAQYAWRTEPANFRFRGSGNGVADLCLLPDGQLLILERGFAFGGLQMRLFLADFTEATNIAELSALSGADFTPVKKTLLYEEATGFINFEGLALGPALEDGSRSLILIADSNGTQTHTFLALKLRLTGPAVHADPANPSPRPVSGGGKRPL